MNVNSTTRCRIHTTAAAAERCKGIAGEGLPFFGSPFRLSKKSTRFKLKSLFESFHLSIRA